jgi:hypothetical protein
MAKRRTEKSASEAARGYCASEKRCYFDKVRRVFFIVTLGAFALGPLGCVGGAEHAAKPPPRLPEKETRAAPSQPARPEPPPRLIAPPPAYGNKIVMADGPIRTQKKRCAPGSKREPGLTPPEW